jgi:hypothetical protein
MEFAALWRSKHFPRVQEIFWAAFIILPIVTGILSYRWLPNESYDQRKHVLLQSETDDEGERAMVWRSKTTGSVYTRAQFASHAREEARRIALRSFAYGLLGCLFFAAARHFRHGRRFALSLRNALLVDVAAALLLWAGALPHTLPN